MYGPKWGNMMMLLRVVLPHLLASSAATSLCNSYLCFCLWYHNPSFSFLATNYHIKSPAWLYLCTVEASITAFHAQCHNACLAFWHGKSWLLLHGVAVNFRLRVSCHTSRLKLTSTHIPCTIYSHHGLDLPLLYLSRKDAVFLLLEKTTTFSSRYF